MLQLFATAAVLAVGASAQLIPIEVPANFNPGNCVSKRMAFDQKRIFPLYGNEALRFTVDPADYDFTHDYGYVDYTGTTANLKLVPNPAGGLATGARLSTTGYFRYGKLTARFKPLEGTGLLTTFVTWSDRHAPAEKEYVQDEIDWEILGKDTSKPETNVFTYKTTRLERVSGGSAALFYGRGLHGGPIAGTIAKNAVHEFSIDWRSDRIDWAVDGVIVKTLNKNQSFGLPGSLPAGQFWFPESASRVQVSVWDSSNQPNWAGGPIVFPTTGNLTAPFEWVDIQCYDDNNNPVQTWSVDGTGAAKAVPPRPKPSTSAAPSSPTAKPTPAPPSARPPTPPACLRRPACCLLSLVRLPPCSRSETVVLVVCLVWSGRVCIH
ncbi:concanavalin A-like lectin/glucanase domain-containing protein [Entophlyctis helioformis]|nr:concanavalin A-like lectin/glucanase domain-containing protein [Entophlyctis helioformis]